MSPFVSEPPVPGSILTNPLGVEIGAVYTLTGADGTVAVFNDPTSPYHVGFLNGEDGVTGLERANVRESADDLPEADGGVHGAFRYGRLAFTLKGLIDHRPGPTHFGILDELAALNPHTNPSFEENLDGWTNSGTFSHSTAWARSGLASARVTATGPASLLGAPFAVTPGAAYTAFASFNVIAVGAPGNLYAYIQWLNSSGLYLSDSAPFGPSTTLGMSDAILTVTAPPSAAFGRVVIFANGGGTGSIDGHVDAVGVVPGTFAVALGEWSESRVRAERVSRLLRATNAMRADAELAWSPTTAPPVRVLFRQQQPTRISGRRPKAFLVAGVSEVAAVEAQSPDVLAIPVAEDDPSGTYSGAATARNAGTVDAWPIITITGLVDPTITNTRSGRALVLGSLGGVAGGTEVITIDTDPRRRTILSNGVPRYSALNWLESAWFPLEPGDNPLEVHGELGGPSSAVSVSWRKAWG